jgi:glycogen debranching enzyme
MQPLLHDLVATVAAPTTALSGTDGQLRPAGTQGVFRADLRVLAQARLLVDGREPVPIAHTLLGPGAARFVSLARWLGDPGPDPTVRLDRTRRTSPYGLTEEIEIISTATVPVRLAVDLELACDLAPIELVKSGGTAAARPAQLAGVGALFWASADANAGNATAAGTRVTASGDGQATAEITTEARLAWTVELPPRGRTTLRWMLEVADRHAVVATPCGPVEWSRPELTADDRRLVRLLDRSLDDLASLRLTDSADSGDTFLAAGSPWFLTLFGRDSLWAARMMLPLGTDLAAGTLRVLARRQGQRVDEHAGEAPGKIMHELRRHEFVVDGVHSLPPAYYGTVDATLLWINLLHDAWRWGMAPAEVSELMPHLEAALGWLADYADPDGDGFIEYLDTTGRGLANQGWKDSGDAMRFHDGKRARPPIALCEVQGYAYQAAINGAALLDAFGRPGGERWRKYAAALAERFRAWYWVDGPQGRYPALALDRDKRPVDALTSNIGHLLGTGILSTSESAAVAELLTSPELDSGFGLRTMSTKDGGYSPLSYHCGSVWTHDTAIVLSGLARDGHGAEAAALAEGLLAAAEAFDYRMPELYSGDALLATPRPVPYPAACRPQAWAAASVVAVLQAALGLYPDVPAGVTRLRPLPGAPLGAIRADNLRVAGAPVNVTIDHAGIATLTT